MQRGLARAIGSPPWIGRKGGIAGNIHDHGTRAFASRGAQGAEQRLRQTEWPEQVGRQGAFQVLLSHAPDLFYWAERAGFDLMLSGHNHGGQVRLPLVGSVFMPSRYSRRFDRDFFRSGPTLLHVSQGIAGKHPVRYGCIPELSRIVLRSPAALRPGSHRAEDEVLTAP